MNNKEVIKKLKFLSNLENVKGMARFGIKPKTKVLGVPLPELRKIAKEVKKDHQLALKLFDSGIHEARILASMLAEPEKFTEEESEKWVKAFDSWDVVDQTCMNLFKRVRPAIKKISKWAVREEEFVKRTSFALMAALAFYDKKMEDNDFIKFFSLIKKASADERNFVKKAVNWALRQIGKRNKKLNKEAIKLAKEIRQIGEKNNSRAAKWIANDALRELSSDKIRKRIKF